MAGRVIGNFVAPLCAAGAAVSSGRRCRTCAGEIRRGKLRFVSATQRKALGRTSRKPGFTTTIVHSDLDSPIEHYSVHKPMHIRVAFGYPDSHDLKEHVTIAEWPLLPDADISGLFDYLVGEHRPGRQYRARMSATNAKPRDEFAGLHRFATCRGLFFVTSP
jgi:hypothetical protein